jgi:hypothetical protein
MNEQRVAAMLDLTQGDKPWSMIGDDLGTFLDTNTVDGDILANVVLEVTYIPEDDDVLLRLPGYTGRQASRPTKPVDEGQ